MKISRSAMWLATIIIALFLFDGCKKESTPGIIKNQTSPNSISNSSLVLVPRLGWIPKDQVHFIEKGYHLRIQGTHILKIENSTGKAVVDFGAVHTEIAISPAKSDSSSVLQSGPQRNLRAIPGNISGANPNWITLGQWSNPSNQPPINYFSTNWIVPDAPTTNHSQTLFIYNGLETSSGLDILQPVLQWGSSAAGGGSLLDYRQLVCNKRLCCDPGAVTNS